MRPGPRLFALATLASVFSNAAAFAQNPLETQPLAETQESDLAPTSTDDRIAALEAQVQQLRNSLNHSPAKPAAPLQPEKPKYPTIKLNGMLHIDAGLVDQDAANRDQLGDIDNSIGFRRARIGVDGFLTEHFYYRFVPDFALGGRPTFRDAFVEFRDIDAIGTIRLGESRQPFGMDAQTPANELLFIERSLANALSPFRQTGLGFRNRNEDETLTWHAAAFGYPTDAWGNAVSDGGFGVATRVTALPWLDEQADSLIHIGIDYAYIHPGSAELRYRSTPEYGGLLTGPNGNNQVVPSFVDTGLLDNARSNLFNLEFATVQGSFTAQAEAVCALVDLENSDSATFHGYYAQVLYVLTGETHGYNREFGSIERLKPDHSVGDGGLGAWELAARYSALDLDDGPVEGGRVHDLTLGVNWFINTRARFQFNYIRSMLDRAPTGDSQANIYATRLAIDF